MLSQRELGILKDLVAHSPLALRQRPRTSANVRDNATASSGARPAGRRVPGVSGPRMIHKWENTHSPNDGVLQQSQSRPNCVCCMGQRQEINKFHC